MEYDVVVVGAGHAGCEAALAAARLGCRTLLLTLNLDHVALTPCNPSIGGPAKGHVVCEIDALGGEMARNTDRTFIQIRMLNTGKGPAVQAPRAQVDKRAYSASMKRVLEAQDNLAIKQTIVEGIERAPEAAAAPGSAGRLVVATQWGARYWARSVVVTTGTSLNGRVITGEVVFPAGRAGEPPAVELSASLRRLGLQLGRLKTGTPPRIDAGTVDFSLATPQRGSAVPLHFSRRGAPADPLFASPPEAVYPGADLAGWRPQLPCYLVGTNERTHAVIRENLDRAPLFTGVIEGVGPRYCPSIEDKIVRFAHKDSHHLFLEPEGWNTREMYVQGANTSLPEDVQIDMLRSIPALRNVEVTRVGYAVEYDYVPPHQITASLECKAVPGLFLAGQINGTSGYEEAAAQGLVAGINAARRAGRAAPPLGWREGLPEGDEVVAALLRGEPLLLPRDRAYIGVMIDDLVTSDISEPYRLFTSRAEYRLLLRQDNADLRLAPVGYAAGLLDEGSYRAVEERRQEVARLIGRLRRTVLHPTEELNRRLVDRGLAPLVTPVMAVDFLRRPSVSYHLLPSVVERTAPAVEELVEIEVKYEGYVGKQEADVERSKKMERWRLPADLDYGVVTGLRHEARQKLDRFRPSSVGQAGRIYGVTPADVAVLLAFLERRRRLSDAADRDKDAGDAGPLPSVSGTD